MSTPYAPPEKLPEALPPNRQVVSSRKTLVIWVFLIVAFVAFYQVFQPQQSHDAPHRVPEPVAPQPDRPMWPLGIPPLTMLGRASAC